MSRVRASFATVWEFLVGDDWRIALGVLLAIALTALVAGFGLAAWWVMAAAVPLVLSLSLLRAARAATNARTSD